MNTVNWHNVKMIALGVISFAVAGLAAIHSTFSPQTAVTIDSITTFLILIEHALAGNNGASTIS